MPKYWLRAFAEDGHVLGRWRSGAEHRTPVRRAAVARDFNTDPLADGEQRVALETYLDRHVDGPCAPVLRALREGRWPLDGAQHALALDALAWQVVRTQAFRSFDEQVGQQVFPALWASEAVGFCEERLGRLLSDVERMEVFWTAVRTGSRPFRGRCDPRSALRAMIRAFERTRDLLTVPGRRLVVLRAAEPLLVLADSGVALRRKDGSFCLTPPLLPETVEVFAPLSPTCLLISTPRAHYRPQQGLTRKIAAKANAGAAAWCQDAVYRLPSMSWPSRLRLTGAPLEVRPPRLTAVPAQQPGPAPAHPEIRRSELRAILEQLTHAPADQPLTPGGGNGRPY
ncbi:DUF4238 domain-containing protein [Streptomyces rochei]|uniref:DUF4238 domain-containing protein n=1 Tax=Streptomyces rochei TaxID=1928 RepID=UPI003D910774